MTGNRPFYTAQELCALLGIKPNWFFRVDVRELYHTRDGMPRPYVSRPMRFDRASIDAWRMRFHPARAGQPANDLVEQPAASTDAEHRTELHEIYGRRRA